MAEGLVVVELTSRPGIAARQSRCLVRPIVQ